MLPDEEKLKLLDTLLTMVEWVKELLEESVEKNSRMRHIRAVMWAEYMLEIARSLEDEKILEIAEKLEKALPEKSKMFTKEEYEKLMEVLEELEEVLEEKKEEVEERIEGSHHHHH
uniref:DerF21_binder10 n=1 Tax=synthetic construct TaxID=32630 RepID=UPI0038D25AE4